MKSARCSEGGGLKMPAMASWYVMACTRLALRAASASASCILCVRAHGVKTCCQLLRGCMHAVLRRQ